MRTFETTHQWIKFSVNLKPAPAKLWLMLGECKSKYEHIAGVPLLPETATALYQVYLAKGALATTAIEGNTLTEDEVRQHLEGKLKLPPSREYLAQEIDNVVAGCNLILSDIVKGQPAVLHPQRIKELNRMVLNKLNVDKEVRPGEVRKHEVGVARYKGAPAEDCEFLLDRLCDWLNGDDFKSQPDMHVVYAFMKAILAHLYLAWIHPFGDGNGRTARLVEFQILLSSGVPAPAAHLLSNHYNQTRTEYYRQLDQASRSGGDVIPFIMYAAQGLVDGLRSQLEYIRTQQWLTVWQNYVHDAFKDQNKPADVRRRHLVLDLSKQSAPVPMSELPNMTPRLAAAYARKTSKTLARDVNALLKLGLIEKHHLGLIAKKDLILAFLPPKADPSAQGRRPR